MNEVDMPGPLAPGMHYLLNAKVPNPTSIRTMLLLGYRFNAADALKNQLIESHYPNESVLEQASLFAKKIAHKAAHDKENGKVYGYLKQGMYSDTYKALMSEDLGMISVHLGFKGKL